MRKTRFLAWMCLASLAIFGINKIADYSGLHLEPFKTALRDKSHPLPPTIPLIGATKSDDSVIPDIFFSNARNITPHDFRYSFNPQKFCSASGDGPKKNIFLVVLIASATWEFERREIIRRTWGAMTKIRGKRIGVLFFMGNDGKFETYAKLKEEFHKYGDIVQEDYAESYRNLSLKTQGQLKWVTLYCPTAERVLHVDDDVIPDITRIMKDQLNTPPSSREIGCAKVFKPIVRRDGKWETSLEEYPADQYPLSCVGWCFILPSAIARELYYMSLDTQVLHLEDVWVTGILREKIGSTKVRKMVGGEKLCQHLGWPKDRPTNEKILEAWSVLKADGVVE